MRLLVFGGSFNPLHIGHLAMAEEARVSFGYDAVVLVPAFRPPHKALERDPGPAARLEMLEAVAADDPALLVDDAELRRGGVSYTVDTLRGIANRPDCDGRPGLLIGDDQAAVFGRWREPDAIVALAELVVAGRDSSDPPEFPWPHRWLGNALFPVSSSLVRERLASGGAWRRLVPDQVRALIEERGWYRG
ncbi:MAG: nicotinate (nicotinamide) nucleotide adenylyltransferase [Spirochaetales bacterium]|nr:nicotinate (nicotinamide) nucleotide adenylyltransferase [Spirochaetales bacterium]